MANGRCDMHGGKSTGTPLKHGLYSQFLPKDLADAYEEHLQNHELLDLTQDVAVVTALATAALQDAKDGAPAAEQWAQARRLCAEASSGENPESLKALGEVLAAGHAQAQKLAQAARLIEQRTKTVERRQKLELETERNLSVVQAMAFTKALAAGTEDALIKAMEHVGLTQLQKDFIAHATAVFIARSLRRSVGSGFDAGHVTTG